MKIGFKSFESHISANIPLGKGLKSMVSGGTLYETLPCAATKPQQISILMHWPLGHLKKKIGG